MTGTTVKSCGNRHRTCKLCNPEWAANIANAARGRVKSRRMNRKPSADAIRRSVPIPRGRVRHSSADDDRMRTSAQYEGVGDLW